MIAHICDKCGDTYTEEWRLMIVKKDGIKVDLCPKCQKALSEWLRIPDVVFVPATGTGGMNTRKREG